MQLENVMTKDLPPHRHLLLRHFLLGSDVRKYLLVNTNLGPFSTIN